MLPIANCEQCQQLFQPKKKNHRFCHSKCYSKYDMLVHGEERRKRHRQWQLANKARTNANQRKYNARKSAGLPLRSCKRCGVDIPRHGIQKFCSISCRDLTRSLRRMNGQPWFPLLAGAKQRAAKRKQPFDLTKEWASARWTGRCELTNIEFRGIEARVGNKRFAMSPSIDKIDPKKGYTQDNCRFIVFAVNWFKGEGSDEDMLFIARELVKNMPHHRPL